MLVTFWGVRGSYPIARRDNVRYGGNSTCIHIQQVGEDSLIMDGGSGIRALGGTMLAGAFGEGKGRANILVGHTHWDHILGYPFFGPFYQRGNHFTFYSAKQAHIDLPGILAGQHQDLHFPVPFEALQAEMSYEHILPGQNFEIGGYQLKTIQLNHPGITLGYRIKHKDAIIVIMTDTARIRCVQLGEGMKEEVDKQGGAAFQEQYRREMIAFVKKADLLIHDSHFLDDEINGKEHWGHSTPTDALDLAIAGRVRHLVLFHHAPDHSDAIVDQKLALARERAKAHYLLVSAAKEGMAIDISGIAAC